MYFLVEQKLRRVWKLNRRSQIFSCGGGGSDSTVLYPNIFFFISSQFSYFKEGAIAPF